MSKPTPEAMQQAVVDGDIEKARELAQAAVDSGADLLAAVESGFAAGIRKVGELWDEGEYFLPELIQGAEAMKAAMSVINPALAANKSATEPKGRVVIGTVQGDLHDIGKTLVGTLLEANGFEVHDLGSDVSVEAFMKKRGEVNANIVAASALLTTTMSVQKALVEAVKAGPGDSVKVLIGGSPTTAGWAESIGATFAENAQRAVTVAGKLVS
ncbi:MAG: cobalamin-dependent protein [Deltaproteobacteria bacterium]|nr:cobalamin-dependent protein [Deltaproteobacteria bacterium]